MLAVLHKRMAKYGLTLHPEKTRLIPFERPRYGRKEGTGSGTFDFLGMTLYWRRSRRGGWYLGMETRKAKVQKFLHTLGEWCRRHRHLPLKDQHAALSRRLRGHFRYFGVNGNSRKLNAVLDRSKRIWHLRLRRRSQRANRLTWKRFNAYLKAQPLPSPTICVPIWTRAP